jgi:hypothetical protein
MKNFLNRQREKVAIFLYITLVASLIYFVVFPVLATITNLNNDIQEEMMKQENVNIHIGELPVVQKQYKALQENGDLSTILLDRNKAVILIEKIEKIAEKTNNKITISVDDKIVNKADESTKNTTKKLSAKELAALEDSLVGNLPSTDYLQMKIVLTGDYKSIINFINILEKFEYYGDITEIKINTDVSNDKLSSSGQSIQGGGMFGSSIVQITDNVAPENNANKDNAIADKGKLAATLQVVFYTN